MNALRPDVGEASRQNDVGQSHTEIKSGGTDVLYAAGDGVTAGLAFRNDDQLGLIEVNNTPSAPL